MTTRTASPKATLAWWFRIQKAPCYCLFFTDSWWKRWDAGLWGDWLVVLYGSMPWTRSKNPVFHYFSSGCRQKRQKQRDFIVAVKVWSFGDKTVAARVVCKLWLVLCHLSRSRRGSTEEVVCCWSSRVAQDWRRAWSTCADFFGMWYS